MFEWLRTRLPSQCAICRSWPAQRLCPTCRQQCIQDAPRCQTCAMVVPPGLTVCGACRSRPPPLATCVAALDYAWPWRGLIAEFKFRGDTALAHHFAGLMQQAPGAQDLLQRCDVLIPMPLSAQRLRERGFHQTLLLARALLARPGRSGITLLAEAVQRQHSAQAQHELPRSVRLRQLRTAFAAHDAQRANIATRKVLLLDDVMTTGASLHALARCVRRAGAQEVHALVLARTPRD